MEDIIMKGVREYAEGMEVILGVEEEEGNRLVIFARNESGCNCTLVDLLDVIDWIRENKPELLFKVGEKLIEEKEANDE